jgi:hypothetical protein
MVKPEHCTNHNPMGLTPTRQNPWSNPAKGAEKSAQNRTPYKCHAIVSLLSDEKVSSHLTPLQCCNSICDGIGKGGGDTHLKGVPLDHTMCWLEKGKQWITRVLA